jgi:GT2 family glycosyltransferase
MELSVIIVNYNVKFFLEQCLHAVHRAIAALQAEIIVVDNHSTDGSVEYLQPLFPQVKFVSPGQNLGFGKANNLALNQASGRYILFLNPDTIIPEDCFVKCIQFFEASHNAGAIGVRMLDGSGIFLPESKRSFPTTAAAFYKLMGLSSLFPRSPRFNQYALGYLDDQHDHRVEVLAGAFMMIRKAVLDKSGGFDENFFMYGEDIDLSYRLEQAGYENWYYSGTSIIHFKGESLKKWSSNHVKVFYEAMMVFVRKHYGSKGLPLRLALLAGIKARALASLFGSKLSAKKTASQKVGLVKAVIVGSNWECFDCYSIFKHAGKESSVVDWFDVVEGGAIVPADVIKFCSEKGATMVVFCTGTLSNLHIIELVQALGPVYSYRFHAAGSKSIVGSDVKSALGEVIA